MVTYFEGESMVYAVLLVIVCGAVLFWQGYLQGHMKSNVKIRTLNIIGVLCFVVGCFRIFGGTVDCVLLFGLIPLAILLSCIACIWMRKQTSNVYLNGTTHSDESIKSHKDAWLLQDGMTLLLCIIVCIVVISLTLKILSIQGINHLDIFNLDYWYQPIILQRGKSIQIA